MHEPVARIQVVKYIIEFYEKEKRYPLNTEIAKYMKFSQQRASWIADYLESKNIITRRKSKITGLTNKALEYVKGN